jgi:hypothetical protein
MAENRKWEQTIGAGYLLGISALALLLALPLLKPEFNIGRLSLKAGTQPYGWPQGITKNPADCYLVIGDWYWYIGWQQTRLSEASTFYVEVAGVRKSQITAKFRSLPERIDRTKIPVYSILGQAAGRRGRTTEQAGATNRLPAASRKRYDYLNLNLEIDGALQLACGRP